MTKFIKIQDDTGKGRVLNVAEISRIDDVNTFSNRILVVMKDGTKIETYRELDELMAEINPP